MKAIDTSVLVAAFATWHESHAIAVAIVEEGVGLPAPCALEAYAVLTRMPPPHRAPPALVRDYLTAVFPDGLLTLPALASRDLVGTFVERGIAGGAAYDAVIALVALAAGATLVTFDQRARATYDRIGVMTQFLP